MKHPMLTLHEMNLSPILKEISLEIESGECAMLIGPNGSGKSSLLKTISGIHVPTSGSLHFLGKPLSQFTLSERAQFIGTMSQDPNLSSFSELTIYENFVIAQKKPRWFGSAKASRSNAAEYLGQFSEKLSSFLDTPSGMLSGGERQSLGLALCLMHHPQLMLLDEHTSALDPASSKKLMELTFSTLAARGASALICTHNLQDALEYGNRLIAMKGGRIILDLKKEQKERLTKKDLLDLYTQTA